MKSSADTIHELLPWYMTGTLDPRLADEFRDHLSGCDDCRDEMTMLEAVRRELAEHGRSFLDDHPSPERVVGAVRGELIEEDAAAVKKHLALCSTCAEEASWVVGEGTYGDPLVETRPERETAGSWRWAAGIAAVLVLASLPWFLVSGPGGARTGVMEVRQLEPARRGAPTSNVYALAKEQTEIVLIVQVDVPPESFPLTVRLVDDGGGTVYRRSGIASLLSGYLHFVCARNDCPAGEYTLEVYEGGGAEPTLTFDFEVVTP